MSKFKHLKSLLLMHRLSSPERYLKTSYRCLSNIPSKIVANEWMYFGRKRRFVVFPGKPVPSALAGVIQVAEWMNYPELKQVKSWRWEYFHDHGDALKVGKAGGLFIYDEDPLMLPSICIELIHYLIFNISYDDYIFREGSIPKDYSKIRGFISSVWE